MKDWPTTEWCNQVARAIEVPDHRTHRARSMEDVTQRPEKVKETVRDWYYGQGKSITEINGLLVTIAQSHNHKLVFVKSNGGN